MRRLIKEKGSLFSSTTPYDIKIGNKRVPANVDYEVTYDGIEGDEYVLGIEIKGVGKTQLRFDSKSEAKELGWILESKKSLHKSIKERFEAPRDWDFEKMVEEYGNEYLQNRDPNNQIFEMDMFDEVCDGYTPTKIVQRCVFGGRYGYKNDPFNINDEYFKFNGYANFESITEDDYVECLTDHINEPYFYDWCVDNGYFESEEDE